ncbi:NUDIX domain-containing protein [Rhizobium sp. FY34]|uniref:NUDIX domain-containing protein n=1 Tax=Rhizobium sp. FY34 TaxID=2562309 RepID=UPI0010C0A776|nr:NUDIX domain-containing protein [Rhizobium sp. FY34]
MQREGVAEISGWKTRTMVFFLHRIFALTRGMTLGVRAACFDDEGRVFLVRHTYVPGWYMPGGGVERGETVQAALVKELREEGNLELLESPEIFHVYQNRRASARDHVIFYRAKVRQSAPRLADREIAESGFFALDALPADVTTATLARLNELAGKAEKAEIW